MHGGAQLSHLHRLFGPWFIWVRTRLIPSDGHLWGQCGAGTLCRGLCCRLWSRDAGREGGGCSPVRSPCPGCCSRQIDANPVLCAAEPEPPRGPRAGARGGSGWLPRASVPPCCQLILKELQQGILTFHSDRELLLRAGLASLLVMVCACPQTLTRREEKREFS